jgi:CHAD domain-containing protein
LRRVEHVLRHVKVDAAQLDQRIQNLLTNLGDARARLKRWPKLEDRFSTMGDGLEQTFRDGQRALQAAIDEETPEAFHELRKRVKDHWYHAQLLRLVWPEFMTRYAEVVEEGSDALGEHHDLIVLRETLREDPNAYGDHSALETTFAAIQKRRKQLERKSIRMSSDIYAERPPQFRDRVRAYWHVARG